MLEDVERIEVIRGPGAHSVGRQRSCRISRNLRPFQMARTLNAAHKLKSATAVFDARGVVETAERLEILGRQNNVSAAGEYFPISTVRSQR